MPLPQQPPHTARDLVSVPYGAYAISDNDSLYDSESSQSDSQRKEYSPSVMSTDYVYDNQQKGDTARNYIRQSGRTHNNDHEEDPRYGSSEKRPATAGWDHIPQTDFGPGTKSQFRCHAYHIPISCFALDIWMDVEIRTLSSNEQIDTKGIASWLWPQIPGKHGTEAQPLTYTQFAAAKRWYGTDNSHRLDLTLSDTAAESRPQASRWLHVCRHQPSFDEFQAIALNAPELNNDWKVVILSLLGKVRDSNSTQNECDWGPWLLRADSSALGTRDQHDINLTATTLSFPYFSIRQAQSGNGSFSYGQLFRQDSEQLFPAMVDKCSLYVPHLWAISMNNSKWVAQEEAFSNNHSLDYVRACFIR
jgi:hypothetical protein